MCDLTGWAGPGRECKVWVDCTRGIMSGSVFRGRLIRSGSLLLLATVFTAGLTFATLELPYYLDGVLQDTLATPGGDSHVDGIARLKTDLFMSHFHVRAIGYTVFFALMGLIVLGFSTHRRP